MHFAIRRLTPEDGFFDIHMVIIMNDTVQLKRDYAHLTGLYDQADTLLGALPTVAESLQADYFQSISPLAAELESAGDTLTAAFISCAEGKGKSQRKTVETTFRKLFAALEVFRQQTKAASSVLGEQLQAHALRVEEALGKAVTVFVQFVELALDRIMQKADLDALRKREPKIAQLLQQLASANAIARS